MAETVHVEGLSALRAKLLRLPAEVRDKELRAATGAAARVVRDAAQALAPVDTGTVRDSVVAARQKPEEFDEQWAVTVSRRKKKGDPFYWRFLEFGTAKMAARPFLRPAFDNNVTQAIEAFRKRMADGLARLARKGIA